VQRVDVVVCSCMVDQGLDMSGAESADQLASFQQARLESKSLDGETGLLALGRLEIELLLSLHFTPLTRALLEERAHIARIFMVERSRSQKHTQYANTCTSAGSRTYQQQTAIIHLEKGNRTTTFGRKSGAYRPGVWT
jgi:hypothetical protein